MVLIGRLKNLIQKYELALVAVGIFAVLLAVYWQAVFASFILDDYVWILPLNWQQIGHLFIGSWEHANTLRPIMRLEYLLNYHLFGTSSVAWHLMNLVLHSAVSTVLYGLIRKYSGDKLVAILATLIFAVYPVNHEVVAWASGQTHSFALLLCLLATWFWYNGVRLNHRVKLVAGYLVMWLAFLTYELSFALPLAWTLIIMIKGLLTKRKFYLLAGAWFSLFALIAYRYSVLAGSIGEVGYNQSNLLLAPFLNLERLITIYSYNSKWPIILVGGFILIVIAYVIKERLWVGQRVKTNNIILFLSLAVLSYLPFSVINGVAPRFIYSSWFFLLVTLSLVYSLVASKLSRLWRIVLLLLVSALLAFSLIRTYQVAERYRQVGDAYDLISETLKRDYPVWPGRRGVLFYGIPDSNQNVLAFYTYFEKFVKYSYGEPMGVVYRAERLTKSELEWVLATKPIVYRFVGFGKELQLLE